MKTVTVEQFVAFGPCWLGSEDGQKRFYDIASAHSEWSALNILNLPDVLPEDKLWAVLRPELIDDAIMHEFACRCAESALKLIQNPDPRSLEAVEAKRAWLRGEISEEQLAAAWTAAWDAVRDETRDAAWTAAWDAVRDETRDAARAAVRAAAKDAARAAAWDAARAAARAAVRDAVRDAAWDATMDAAWAAARAAQIEDLKKLLSEQGN